MKSYDEATYENVEALLKERFNVLAMVRDQRGEDHDLRAYLDLQE